MITQLGRMQPRRLGVIARITAMRFKGTDKRADQIGQELGVSYILEGSVRRSPLIVCALQPSSSRSQTRRTFGLKPTIGSRPMSWTFNVRSQADCRVTDRRAYPGQQTALSRASTRDSEAHEAYLKGRYFWNKRTEEEYDKAIAYFEQAIARDSNYALAFTGLC